MSYLIYLKNSYMYKLKRHVILFVILTCAMILPLTFSIYRDSIIFGQQSYVQYETKGQDYHVLNANSEYIDYFRNIPGLSSYYDDNTIYISIMSEEDGNNPVLKAEFDQALFRVINEINDEQLLLRDMSRFGNDESNYMFSNQLLFVNMFIIIISLIIIQSAYKNHLKKFIPDIGVLISCGADNKQIGKIFLIDFIITYTTSALTAIITSSVLMYLLFHNFLNVKDVGNLSWIIFKINPYSIAIHIILIGLAFFFMVMQCLNQYLKQTSIKMLSTDDSGTKLRDKRKTLKIRNSSLETLANLLSQRTKSKITACLIITIPITIIVIFIFNYLVINIESISKSPDYEITIYKEVIMPNEAGITGDDIAFVENIKGVNIVKKEFNIPTTKYLVKDNRAKGNSFVELGNDRYIQTKIQPYSNPEKGVYSKDFNSSKYNVAISKNHEYIKYKVGDKISLYLNELGLSNAHVEHESHDHGTVELSMTKLTELTVVQLLDDEWTDRMFSIYFTDEMYQELTRDEPLAKLNLKLDNPNESKAIESVLNDKFAGIEYRIRNNHDMFEKNKESSLGIYIMTLFIIGIMFAFILVILYVRLTDYVESQHENIRTFHILGASETDLYESYMRLPINVSMISIIASFVVGLGLCILFFMNSGYHLIMNLTTFSVHMIIALLILIAFNVPVHITLKSKLKQL